MSHRNVVVHNGYSVPTTTTSSSKSNHAYRYTSSSYSGSSSTMSSQDLSYGSSTSGGRTRPDQSGLYRDRDANGHRGQFFHRDGDHNKRNVTVWQGAGHRNGTQNEPTPDYRSKSKSERR